MDDDIDALLADSGSEYEPGSDLSSDSDGNVQALVPARRDLRRTSNKNKKDWNGPKTQNKLNGLLGDNGPVQNGTPSKRSRSEDKKNSGKKKPVNKRIEKPFNKLFEGVIFTISGFQNPYRSELRSKAIALGAKYKPDWDSQCTHLLCAFPNTPKFIQVLGNGKIITKDWIEACYNKRMRLPWRRYALHPPDKAAPESEDEIFEKVERPPSPVDNRRRISPGRSSGEDTDEEIEKVLKNQREIAGKANSELETEDDDENVAKEKLVESAESKISEEVKNEDNGVIVNKKEKNITKPVKSPEKTPVKRKHIAETKVNKKPNNVVIVKDNKSPSLKNYDSPEKHSVKRKAIDSMKEKNSPKGKKKQKLINIENSEQSNIYEIDTEEEDESSDSKKYNLPYLPTFFDGVSFHIGNDMEEGEYYEVQRYILAHKGTLVEEDDLSSKNVDYLIAVSEAEVKKIKDIQPKVEAVRPEWIWKAHDEGRIPPTAQFTVEH